MEAKGRRGREGEEREKGKRLGGPRLRSHTEHSNRFCPHPQQRPQGQRGPQRSPHAIQLAEGRRHPRCYGRGPCQEQGAWGRDIRRIPLCLQLVGCSTPRDQFEFPFFASTALVSIRAGRQPQLRMTASSCQTPPRIQTGRPTACVRPTQSAPWLPRLSLGQGNTMEGRTRGERFYTSRKRMVNLCEDRLI